MGHQSIYWLKIKLGISRPQNGTAFTFGLCIPAMCSLDFLQELLQIDESIRDKIDIKLLENSCQLEEYATGLKPIDWVTM